MTRQLRVSLAAQMLNENASAGISLLVSTGRLPAQAAEFNKEIDELFDSFNSRNLKAKKYTQHPISSLSIHWGGGTTEAT